MNMNELLSLLNDYLEERKILSIYSNHQDTSLFSVGIVAAVSEEDTLLQSIAPDGTYDGYQTIPLSEIYMVCADGTYEEEIGRKYFSQEKQHHPIHTTEKNLRKVLLSFAMQVGCCVSLELCKSGKWDIQGQVLSLSDEMVCIDVYDIDYTGKCFIKLQNITELEADSCDERVLEKKQIDSAPASDTRD